MIVDSLAEQHLADQPGRHAQVPELFRIEVLPYSPPDGEPRCERDGQAIYNVGDGVAWIFVTGPVGMEPRNATQECRCAEVSTVGPAPRVQCRYQQN